MMKAGFVKKASDPARFFRNCMTAHYLAEKKAATAKAMAAPPAASSSAEPAVPQPVKLPPAPRPPRAAPAAYGCSKCRHSAKGCAMCNPDMMLQAAERAKAEEAAAAAAAAASEPASEPAGEPASKPAAKAKAGKADKWSAFEAPPRARKRRKLPDTFSG